MAQVLRGNESVLQMTGSSGVLGSCRKMQDLGQGESNPRHALPNQVALIGVTETAHRVSRTCQYGPDATWPELTIN